MILYILSNKVAFSDKNAETSFWHRFKDVSFISAPAAITMLSYTMVGVVDLFMVGKLGPAALAAVGLVNTFIHTVSGFSIGVIGAITPLASQSEGSNNRSKAGKFAHQAVWLAIITGILISTLLFIIGLFVLPFLTPSKEVANLGTQYLFLRSIGIPFWFMIMARDQFLEAIGDTKSPMKVGIFVNVVNVICNIWFIYGGLGLPAMGVMGSAIATSFAHIVSFFIYQMVIRKKHNDFPEYKLCPLQKPDKKLLLEITKVGWPMGVHYTLDTGSWCILMIFLGWFGENTLAASQIALRSISMIFMVIEGVSLGVSSLSGRAIGANNIPLAKKYINAGLCLGFLITFFASLSYIFYPLIWIKAFTSNTEVTNIAVNLLYSAILFVIAHTFATILYGGLKGAGDSKQLMWISVFTAWVIGIPVGYFMGFFTSLGPSGIYMGLVAQLFCATLLYMKRLSDPLWGSSIIASFSETATRNGSIKTSANTFESTSSDTINENSDLNLSLQN